MDAPSCAAAPGIGRQESEDLRSHLARLPAAHPLRAAVERVLAGGAPTNDEVARAFVTAAPRNLPEHSTAEVVVAAWLLGAAPLTHENRAAARSIVATLSGVRRHDTERSYRRASQASYTLLAAAGSFAVVVVCSYGLAPVLGLHFGAGPAWLGLMGPALLFVSACAALAVWTGMMRSHSASSAVRCAGLLALGHIGGPAEVGLLAEAALDGDPPAAAAARAAIRRAAPRVTAEDANSLVGWPVDLLHRLLRRLGNLDDPETSAAIVGLMARTGSTVALQFVHDAAQGPAPPVMRDAARAALPALEERLRQERGAAALVRPSAAPDAGTLVRPAEAASATPEEQLVRPSNPPPAGT